MGPHRPATPVLTVGFLYAIPCYLIGTLSPCYIIMALYTHIHAYYESPYSNRFPYDFFERSLVLVIHTHIPSSTLILFPIVYSNLTFLVPLFLFKGLTLHSMSSPLNFPPLPYPLINLLIFMDILNETCISKDSQPASINERKHVTLVFLGLGYLT